MSASARTNCALDMTTFIHALLGCCFGARKNSEPDSEKPNRFDEDKVRVARASSSSKAFSTGLESESDIDCTNDGDFWWNSTALILQTLLCKSGYSQDEEEKIMKFYHAYVINNLGPPPTAEGLPHGWRSFMTDDFTPMEFSWNWGLSNAFTKPTIRFSVEPIERNAGQLTDPWNWNATFNLVKRFEKDLPGFDGSLFNRLGPPMMQQCELFGAPDLSPRLASPSSLFMAFDLCGSSITAKGYIVPFVHLAQSEHDRGRAIRDLLLPMAREPEWGSLARLLDFGLTSSKTHGVAPWGIAFDCVPDPRNRVKIYFRSKSTSLSTVIDILTAHDKSALQGQALSDLRSLYQSLFFAEPVNSPVSDSTPLRQRDHETAGMLFYYEVKPNSPEEITAKVYLPIKHYGINDRHTTDVLAAFFRPRQSDGVDWAGNYVKAVESMCQHRDLSNACGLHSYVSCSVKKGGLDVTSYFNPEIYHPGRRR